uniref:Meiosis expressed gene 1 protein homolog n=1 Tax=Ciona savignyi TaxID=51511 RepID=H2YMI6_CIOSA
TKTHLGFGDGPKPKSMVRAKRWSEEVENAFRFQTAGYRDEIEYKIIKKSEPERWTVEPGYVKKLQRRDGTYYYYNRARECQDKEVHKIKLYQY